MQNRTPVARAARPPLPDFAPVPRLKHRHDGWTPERQKAFIEALADTGSVSRAAAMVNMAQANCYTLRRAPGAEQFRAAWDAALDFGLARLKDIAFERAIEGQLEPMVVGGKLLGYRRRRNDALLMFCLRHYGQDANGRRTTINYFSTRASAGASGGEGGAGAAAEASTTTVRTVLTDGGATPGARIADAADHIEGFDGVPLDHQAHAEIAAALEACAARARLADAAYDRGNTAAARDMAEDDPEECFIPSPQGGFDYRGDVDFLPTEDFVPFVAGEGPWRLAGAEMPDWAAMLPAPKDDGVAEVKKAKPRRRKGG